MNRREAIIVLVALGAVPLVAEAQQAANVARIGYLSPNLASSPHLRDAFLEGLRDLGYVEGRNVVRLGYAGETSSGTVSSAISCSSCVVASS